MNLFHLQKTLVMIIGVIRLAVGTRNEAFSTTISVFEVNRNSQGKYLPGFYTVSFWNKDGSLKSSNTVCETWVRVGSIQGDFRCCLCP